MRFKTSGLSGAQDWNRTSTSLRMADFESAASTNSATWACVRSGCNITSIPFVYQKHRHIFKLFIACRLA